MPRIDSMVMNPWISRNRSAEYGRFVLQKQLVEKYFPCFHCRFLNRRLTCKGQITPSEDCDTYTISISYPFEGVPRVWVTHPQVSPSTRTHVYRNGDLCLYEPRESPWGRLDNIHQKIIPWMAEWLVFYELYLISGKWLGPEAPHGAGGKLQQTVTAC